ncbi:MAG: chromate efflux transporter [Bacteroidota bacterium]|nr:chromate efflux transporter [Bacteroidota bacterium]
MKLTNRYLFFLFLKIGATSWGGFMALIAVIQKQMSELDNAIEEREIVHAVSLASVLPGPMAVNVVAYIGYKLKGWKGAFISIAAVLLPCFLLMLALSYFYFRYGNMLSFALFFKGIAPAVAAIVLNVAVTMQKKNVTDVYQVIIASASVAALLLLHSPYTTLLIICVSGLAGYFIYRKKELNASLQSVSFFISKNKRKVYAAYVAALLLIVAFFYFLSFQTTAPVHLYSRLVFTFSGLSLSQFGGGYVVIPSMQKLIVDGLHWLSQQQFTDAIALGQITPGPIYISAAFVGYKLEGVTGAFVATAAMFVPSALLMIFCARFLNRIAKAPAVVSAFKGIGAAITGMVGATAIMLLSNAQTAYLPLLVLFIICFFLSYQFKITPVFLIPLAGIAGAIIY